MLVIDASKTLDVINAKQNLDVIDGDEDVCVFSAAENMDDSTASDITLPPTDLYLQWNTNSFFARLFTSDFDDVLSLSTTNVLAIRALLKGIITVS
jgi:hypothetical protein